MHRLQVKDVTSMKGADRWGWLCARAACALLLVAGAGESRAQQRPSPQVPQAPQARPSPTAGAPAAAALGASGAVPAPPGNVVAAKAYATLERSCASCHQAGRLAGRPPGGGIANLLALDEIVRDPSLVRPGVPDASRIYNVALTRELHHDDLNDPASPAPTPIETQALRDWIADLPQRPTDRCRGRQPVSQSQVGSIVGRALVDLPPERARQTRFLSLAHLSNVCLAEFELEALRRAVPSLIAGMAPAGATEPAEGWARPTDAAGLVYTVSLTAIGWRPDRWNALVAGYPLQAISAAATPAAVAQATGSSVAVVHADWFADAVHAARTSQGPADSNKERLWGLPLPEALARAWARPADLARATADLGLPGGQKLMELPGWAALKNRAPAILLRSGSVVRRHDLGLFLTALVKSPAGARQPSQPTQLEIALAADKAAYKAGDTATFSVVVNRDCYLTLVSVDRHGRAMVLFPNELAPDNRIVGGNLVEVPAAAAPYRFRFKDKGRETIVGTCSENQKAPIGIAHDYDRLRFTVLGDWQLFLREPPEMREARRDDAATDIPRPLAKPRRRGRPGDIVQVPAADAPDIQTRTAITIDID